MHSRSCHLEAPLSQNLLVCSGFNRGDASYILGVLEKLGLSLDEDGGLGTIVQDADGSLRLEARGEAVRGYLLADDGEEAELQDIKRLVLACAQPSSEVCFSGSCWLGPGKLLVISSRAQHDGRIVHWSSKRTVIGPAGGAKTVRDSGYGSD